MASEPFRVGDRVIIDEPMVVLRVGYPLCVEDGLKYIREDQDVQSTLRDAYANMYVRGGVAVDDKARAQIERALARSWLRQQRFGGRERTIHASIDETLRGKETYVLAVRTVRTGQYVPSWGGGDPAEYDPAYLGNMKSHRLALLGCGSQLLNSTSCVEIETCNLRKI